MKRLLLIFLIMITIPLYSKKEYNILKRKYNFIITPYFFYKGHIYFNKDTKYSENYYGYGLEGSFKLTSFFIISVAGGRAGLQSVLAEGTADKFSNSTDTTRIDYGDNQWESVLYLVTFKFELFFMTNPENMFYIGPTFSYLWFDEMKVEHDPVDDTAKLYSEHKASYPVFGICIGDRFLLFPSIIFNLEVTFSGTLKERHLPMEVNNRQNFTNYFIDLRLGIGLIF